jgi:hypothetical protein
VLRHCGPPHRAGRPGPSRPAPVIGSIRVATWSLTPCHRAFRDAYHAAGGPADGDGIWARARGWALALALACLANPADNPLIAAMGRRTMDAVLG